MTDDERIDMIAKKSDEADISLKFVHFMGECARQALNILNMSDNDIVTSDDIISELMVTRALIICAATGVFDDDWDGAEAEAEESEVTFRFDKRWKKAHDDDKAMPGNHPAILVYVGDRALLVTQYMYDAMYYVVLDSTLGPGSDAFIQEDADDDQ